MKDNGRLNLIPNWRLVLRYAWSIRFSLLAAASAGVSAMIPYTTPGGPAFVVLSAILAGCAALLAGLAAFSRVIQQSTVRPDAIDK